MALVADKPASIVDEFLIMHFINERRKAKILPPVKRSSAKIYAAPQMIAAAKICASIRDYHQNKCRLRRR